MMSATRAKKRGSLVFDTVKNRMSNPLDRALQDRAEGPTNRQKLAEVDCPSLKLLID